MWQVVLERRSCLQLTMTDGIRSKQIETEIKAQMATTTREITASLTING